MTRKLTQEEFEHKVQEVHDGNIIVLSKYVNSKSKVHFKDIRCQHDWWAPAGPCYQRGHGCPICGAKYGTRIKSTSQVKDELDKCTNGEYEIATPFQGMHKSIILVHKKCGYHWETRLDSVINGGQRCPNCSHHRKLTTEDFKQQVHDSIGDDYTVLSEYKNSSTKIKMRHKVCGCEYETLPYNIVSNHSRCPKCFGTPKHTLEEVHEIINEKLGPEFQLVSDYKNTKEKITIEHVPMKHSFTTMLGTIVAGGISCPICNESHMESLTRQYLIEHKIQFEAQKKFSDCRYKRELPFDFYLPEYNLLIELDGGQHFEEVPYFDKDDNLDNLATRTKRDTIKDNYCTSKGINLLRVGYSELDNLTDDLDKYLSNFQGILRIGKEYQQ